MFRKYRDAVCGVLLILLGLLLIYLSFGIRSVALNLIKADFFPRLDAGLLIILGAILTVMGIRQAKDYKAGEEEQVPLLKNDATVSMLETLALIALYVLAMKRIGFVISTFVYLLLQMWVLTPREKRTGKNLLVFALISLAASVVIYLVFVKVFYLMLPAGLLRL